MSHHNIDKQKRLNQKLTQNNIRLQKIAELEARGAQFNSGAADGRLDPERQRLIEENNIILDELENIMTAHRNTSSNEDAD